MRLEVFGVEGLPEIDEGDDLGALIATNVELLDGDVVVVAQKVISKMEGRMVAVDPARRDEERVRVVAGETARVVARRGEVLIVRTHHGFVCANAGVDASNVAPDRLALLPVDPDLSAATLRAALARRCGVDVGVIISDTFGRPWRAGQTNVALGVAGIAPMRDFRGEKDSYGLTLEATVIAIADELAAAAEMVMGKSDGVPVAIVRGAPVDRDDAATGRALLRPPDEDLFATGALDAVSARRTVREFAPREVAAEVIEAAVAAALSAPAPHGSRNATPFHFVWLRSAKARTAFLDALAEQWRDDLASDGAPEDVVARRLARSDALLREAPVLIACFVSTSGADTYADERRQRAERDMFIAAAGGATQSMMIALAAQGVGSCWVSSSIFAPQLARAALGLDERYQALGCVVAGYPRSEPVARAPLDATRSLEQR